MLVLPNTTTTDQYTDAGAAVFPGTDSGALTPYANGFLFVANQPAFISVRVGRTSGSSGVWTPDSLVQPTLIPLTVATNVGNPQFIFGVRARNAVAGQPAQVFGALFQAGEVSFVPGNQFSGTVSPSGGFSPANPVTRGSGVVTWPGGSQFSNTLVVPHGLISTPASVVLTGNGSTGVTSFPSWVAFAFTPTSFTVQCQTLDAATPANTATSLFDWIATT